jgi:hemoglobin/transferrin/lactoferrin receptor protein
MKINYLWLISFLLVGHNTIAQIVTVRDNNNRQALELVTIYSPSADVGVFTDANGQADISVFVGATDIQFSSVGYRTITRSYAALEANNFRVFLSIEDISLSTIIVSASRWQQSSRDVPNKITTISPKEMQLQNPQTAADMLETTGMVFVQKSQLGGGSPMIRGFATNRVLITVDGVRMNTAIFRSGNVQNVISLDPFAVENTEVVFGPGSTIYGSDAIGGVMNFYTLTPSLSSGEKTLITGSGTMRYSSANNEGTVHADVNIGLNKWAFLSSFTYSSYGNLRMGKNGPNEYLRNTFVRRINGRDSVVTNPDPLVQVPSGYDQYNIMQKVRFAPNQNWDINYSFHYSETSAFSRYDRLIRPRGNSFRSAEWAYGPQVWMLNKLKINLFDQYQMFDQMTVRLAHQLFEETRIDRDFNDPNRRTRVEQVNAYSANVDMEKKINGNGRLFYGLEYIFNGVGSVGRDTNIVTNESARASSRYPDGSDWQSYAAYASYQYKATDKLTIQLSSRYNQVGLNAEFDRTFYPFPFENANINSGAFTGSVGVVYNPREDWQIGTNLSTGFRSPNIDDIGKVFDSSPGTVVVPNPDLNPEYSSNVDVAIARTIGNIVKLDVTGFYNFLDNALVRRDFKFNGQDSIVYDGALSRVQAIQNVAFAKVYGVQAGIEVSLPFGFGISSRYNWQKGSEELDDETEAPLRHSPPTFGITRFSYNRNGLRTELYAMYNGEISNERLAPEEQGKEFMYAIDANGNPFSPAWFTLNFKAQYQMNNGTSLMMGLENILNERYRPYSSGIVAPGRNFIVSVRTQF